MVCIASSRIPTPMSVITLRPSRVESSAGQEVKSRFRTSTSFQFSASLIKGGFDELHQVASRIKSVPGLRARESVHISSQGAVIIARILEHLHQYALLAQRPIHLQALAERVHGIAFTLDEHKRCFCLGDIGEGALAPGILAVFPRLTVEPAVIPRLILRAVFALLIGDRSRADDRLESVGLALDEGRHFAAVAVAHQRELVAIDWIRRDHGVDARHDVSKVAAAQGVLIRRRKGGAIPGTAARIRQEKGPSLCQKRGEQGQKRIGEGAGRAAMYLDDQGNLVRGVLLRREIKHPLDVETFVLPSHRMHGWGFPLGWEQIRRIEQARYLSGLRRKIECRRLRPALPKPHTRRMPYTALQFAHNGAIEVQILCFAAADACIPPAKAELHGLKYARSHD